MKAPNLIESILLAEKNLGFPPLFVIYLYEEKDEWTFVLKLHCIMEMMMNWLLEKHATERELDEWKTFSQKVEMTYNLPELRGVPQYKNLLLALNKVRNLFAHNACNMVRGIKEVIESEPNQSTQARIYRSIRDGLFFAEQWQNEPEYDKSLNMTVDNPKYVLFGGVLYAMAAFSLLHYAYLGRDKEWYTDNFNTQLEDILSNPRIKALKDTGIFNENIAQAKVDLRERD